MCITLHLCDTILGEMDSTERRAHMNLDIINQPKTITLYGVSKVHDENKDYSAEIFELLDRVWPEVREKSLAHTGINHVVYDCEDVVFAGIELKSPDEPETSLVKMEYTFQRYAYWKHIGPYSELEDVYNKIFLRIKDLGLTSGCPNMEIYGHWNNDESKLETEIYITLE